jgi:isopropylmalate/homocitrate/citramalate synthase
MKYACCAEICTKQDMHVVQDFNQNSNLKLSTVLKDFADTAHKCRVPVPDNNASTGTNIFVTKLSFHNRSCKLGILCCSIIKPQNQ